MRMRTLLLVLGIAVGLGSFSTNAYAGGNHCYYNCGGGSVPSAPEVDPSSLMSGLGLLSGGLMVLRARFRR